MPKSKPLSQKERDIKRFIKLTWEVVRRNREYREDHRKFLQNYGLTLEDLKPKKRKNASTIRCQPPLHKILRFNPEKGRYVLEDEKADPERCNLAYMTQRWGFAGDPDDPTPLGAFWLVSFSKDWQEIRKKEPPLIQPLADAQMFLQRMPGVLEVEKWPEFWATSESLQKYRDALGLAMEGWKPKNERELLEFQEATRLQWEIKDSPLLTISINLKAPSWLIEHALFLSSRFAKRT